MTNNKAMRALNKLLRPFARRLNLIISRAVVLRSSTDSGIQTLQIQRSSTEVFDDVEHMEPYGLTSRPHDNAEAVIVARGGVLSHLLALVTPDRRHRLSGLANGEVALYDDIGNRIVLRRDRIEVSAVDHVEVTAPTCTITATTSHNGDITINGNLQVSGTIQADGSISSPDGVSTGGIQLGTHLHGGVNTGPGKTGVPE